MDGRRGLLLGQMHGVEPQLGVGVAVHDGYEAEALFAVAEVVGEFGHGQTGRVGILRLIRFFGLVAAAGAVGRHRGVFSRYFLKNDFPCDRIS